MSHSRSIGALVILAVTLGLGALTEGGLSVTLLTLSILAAVALSTSTLINAFRS